MTDVYNRISKGGVSVEEITEAMQEATEAGGQFYQGMEQASLTTEGLMSTLKDNFNSLVGEVFQPLSEMIKTDILPTEIGYIDQLTEAFRTNGIEGLTSASSEILSNILLTFAENLPFFIETAANMVVSLIEGLSNNKDSLILTIISITIAVLDALATILPKLPEFAIEFIVKLGLALVENLSTLIEKVMKIGDGIVQGIKDGIRAAWGGLVSWFNGIWDSLFGNRNVNVSANGQSYTINGSHRSGLNYVPFDGYIAELHKGERVLTADEARAQDSGKAGGVSIIQNIYSEAKTAADLMSEALYQQERAVLLGV